MEDWILTVLGRVNGVPDFLILIQIQVSKWSKEIVEALCHGGLNKMLGPVGKIKITNQRPPGGKLGRFYYLAEFSGIDQMQYNGQVERINFFWISFELPATNAQTAGAAVNAMIGGVGLRQFLGPYCQSVTFHKKGETHPGAFEDNSNKIKVQ